MESHSVSGQVVFPVFYHVTPSYIRYLTETDGEALYANKAKDALLSKKDKLENRTKDPFVGMWKKALRDAKALAGWDVRHYSNESNIVKEIVSEVLKRVDKTYLSITNFPVGLTSRVHHVIKFLQKPNRGVCMGTRAIEGLAMKMQRTSGFCVNAKAFKKMMRLRLLQLNYVKLVGEYEYLPKHLRWLYWRGFPLQYIPDNFPLGNAAAIDLKYSNLQIVWKEPQIDMLEEDIVRMESLTTLIADNTSVKQVPFSIVRSKNIEYLSLCGYEGLARDVLPSIIWSWMSPSTNLVSCIQPFGSMSTSLISMNIQDENLCELFPVLGGLANLRSISVQFESEFHLAKEFRRILDDLCDINLTELKRTSHASQIPEKATGAHLIGMGSYHQVINRLSKNISEGLAANGSGDFSLPSHNHPYWLAYTGQGNSVHFRVPEDRDHLMKGMILCVVYSSTSVSMAIECLKGVLIVNYTKCTVQIYRRDTTMSFNDVDWQAIISNLGPGDNVEIFVAFGHGLTVRNTTAYLIYNQSITVELESPINIKTSLQPSPIVTIEFPCNMKKNLSPTVAIELPCKMETDPHPNVTIEIPGNTKTNPSPNVTIDSSSNMKMELSSDVKLDLSSDVKLDPVPNVNLDRSPEPKKSIYSRLTKTMRACLCLNRDFHNF
ncbi:hypothetical protein RJT34_21983 [Clitoria ternatea]|uniref:TIR domain-containing protein n=1 Tax=Clitoria ternatea TaxID=43366 RepID=A0AAN9P654_CLITE